MGVQSGSPSRQRSPNKLSMTAGRESEGSPRGRPSTARTCCSNWEVAQRLQRCSARCCEDAARFRLRATRSRRETFQPPSFPRGRALPRSTSKSPSHPAQRSVEGAQVPSSRGDVVSVHVVRDRIDLHFSVGGSRKQHGDLRVEGHQLFEHGRSATHLLPTRFQLVDAADHGLPFSVVAGVTALQHTWEPDRVRSFSELHQRVYGEAKRLWRPDSIQEASLFVPILNRAEHARRRTNGANELEVGEQG